MTSYIDEMSELHRQILHHLMAGWMTMDEAKHDGIVPLHVLAQHFGLPPDEMQQELALLEAQGYVDNVHSMGMDQTMYYEGIEQESVRRHDPENPTYFITENGKRLVIAETTTDDGRSDAAPSS
jgi:hypothetical protein